MALILLIEDDHNLRSVLVMALEKSGHEVVEAPNGKIGMKEFRKRPADLVITDIIMPEKDGIETIMTLKKEFPDVKIIAISGGGRGPADLYIKQAEILGATRGLTKPFTVSELLDAVGEVLRTDE